MTLQVPTLGHGVLSDGFTDAAHATTLGLNWIVNDYTRFMLNWIHTEFDTPVTVPAGSVDSEDALTVWSQINF
jgi:phosphate-selective porin OprO/OprP